MSFILHKQAMEYTDGTSYELGLLRVMCYLASDTMGGFTYASAQKLIELSGLSKSAYYRTISDLKAKDLIKSGKYKDKKGFFITFKNSHTGKKEPSINSHTGTTNSHTGTLNSPSGKTNSQIGKNNSVDNLLDTAKHKGFKPVDNPLSISYPLLNHCLSSETGVPQVPFSLEYLGVGINALNCTGGYMKTKDNPLPVGSKGVFDMIEESKNRPKMPISHKKSPTGFLEQFRLLLRDEYQESFTPTGKDHGMVKGLMKKLESKGLDTTSTLMYCGRNWAEFKNFIYVRYGDQIKTGVPRIPIMAANVDGVISFFNEAGGDPTPVKALPPKSKPKPTKVKYEFDVDEVTASDLE
ncbi:MAG: hypothetical protein OEX12_12705 [Gammaproteobacteria bacterium]|nr:hypothetical protein [Gammaproteobacteria bacterium]